MKRESSIISDYKVSRDKALSAGNIFCAAYFEALIVEEIEKSPFSLHKKKDLEQHWKILYKMFNEILGFEDKNYFMGIYYEMILTGEGKCLTGNEEECRKCNKCFENSDKKEYVFGAYQLHMSCIVAMAENSMEAAKMYADNILKLLEVRYGVESLQYAKMWLHIIGEYIYQFRREEFLPLFKENYTYLEKYLAGVDCFFCEVMIIYTYFLAEKMDKDYEIWMNRCETLIEQHRDNKLYNYFKCKITWLKARTLRMQNQNKLAVRLLQEVIAKYLITDNGNRQLFYGYVYLEAAFNCFVIRDYARMYAFSQAGIEICRKLEEVGSELYYNLYSYIGIMFIQENNLKAAQKLYSSCIKDIVEKFGKESENYVVYMSNLGIISLREGKSTDIYTNIIMDVKDEKLRKQCIGMLCNELIGILAKGDSIYVITQMYKKCVKKMQGEEYRKERVKLGTVYLSAKISEHKFNDATLLLMKELGDCYKNNYTDELSIMYWTSVAAYKLEKGMRQEVLEIYEKIMREIKKEEYERYSLIVVNYIQLLILTVQYGKAKELILTMADVLNRQIMNICFGSIFIPLYFFRMILSMYIHMMEDQENGLQLDKEEIKVLFEKIVYCKTIEREIKSLLSQYKEENAKNDLYLYNQVHRKLAALELRKQVRGEDYEYYQEKRWEYILEKEEMESKLRQEISVGELIEEFKLENISIPENAVCAEYFAYYNFDANHFMTSVPNNADNKELYSYFVFVLCQDRTRIKILDMSSIFLEESMDDEMSYLLDSTVESTVYEEIELEGIIGHFYSLFAAPVMKYAQEIEIIYLGLDFVLQMLPIDLIFYDRNKEPKNVILVDSIRYIGEDAVINIKDSDALILGNPQYNIHEDQHYPALQYSEIECKEIAKLFGVEAYIGKMAKQKILWEQYQQSVIHISTHGNLMVTETSFKDDLFINSYLMMAGHEDWLNRKKDRDYGNGIVTGDDFLFMDLSRTDLVVLSACVSGLGITKGLESLHGMRWAIGTAGARNSVTSLWPISDWVTAILMILFYRNLKDMPVGKSLYVAKRCLRMITVDELKKDEVLWCIAKDKVQDITNQDYRPFTNWRYWAAFVCYCR